jgi:hypothetical protein
MPYFLCSLTLLQKAKMEKGRLKEESLEWMWERSSEESSNEMRLRVILMPFGVLEMVR